MDHDVVSVMSLAGKGPETYRIRQKALQNVLKHSHNHNIQLSFPRTAVRTLAQALLYP
jgi:hypothetical protein